MKYILLIGDGMGDVPVAELDNKTPLAAANKPMIDSLAQAGEQLLVRTVPKGYPPGSDVANLSLLGYEPGTCYTGRAPLEAAAMGVPIQPGENAFRCNLVSLEKTGSQVMMRDYSAGHITTPEATQLIEAIEARCGTERLKLYPGVSYRHLLIQGGDIAALETTPPHDHLDQDVSQYYQAYQAFPHLREFLELSEAVLADHPVNRERARKGLNPANFLWLWGNGVSPKMETLVDRYGMTGGLISAVDLLRGIGVCSGLEVIEVEGVTGYLDTNYAGKAAAALAVLEKDDFVVVHVEAPDEAGHQGSLPDKMQAIEDFDAKIVAPIVNGMREQGEDFRLVVTMDHYTPLVKRSHEDWPVPMVLYDSRGLENRSGLPYHEAATAVAVEKNGLALESGADFFRRFIEADGK